MLLDSLPDGINLALCLDLPDQRQAFCPVRPFADQEKDFLRRTGRQVNMQLDGGTWVQPGIHRARQSNPPERRRGLQAAHAPQKLRPVGGHAMRFFTGGQERHTLAKLAVEAVGGKQGMLIGDELWHDMGLVRVTRCAEHPFGVIGDGDTPWTLP